MNKNIKLAVAGAIFAAASAAQAGIVIPAGDWTLDVSGNVNMYSSWGRANANNSITGAQVGGGVGQGGGSSVTGASNHHTTHQMGNGLLPNFLSFSGSTRQNDLDVAFTISLQPGSQNSSALNGVGSSNNGGLNNRQAFITVGDKSWGSIKIGKDLGIYASDAILSDVTLLGVGGAYAGAAGNTSLGRIGFGYQYADWKPQISYTTPNFSGFQATVGITQAFGATGSTAAAGSAGYSIDTISAANTFSIATAYDVVGSSMANASPAYEGKASYSFAASDVKGKIWVSGIAQHVGSVAGFENEDSVAYSGDIGANINVANFDVTGYYYGGNGLGTTGQFLNSFGYKSAGKIEGRDSDGGYVQVKYTLPTKTTAAVSWGISNLDKASGETWTTLVKENEMWNAMLIHPVTKHLNAVAEYSYQRSEDQGGKSNNANVGSVGAILFF